MQKESGNELLGQGSTVPLFLVPCLVHMNLLVHEQATICDAFPLESDYESKIWHSLLITGIGLTAVATMLALNHR